MAPKSTPEQLLYRYAVKVTGQNYKDPAVGIVPQAKLLLLNTFMSAAYLDDEDVRVTIKPRKKVAKKGKSKA